MRALREHLLLDGYRLDAIGELELVDAELRRIVEGYGETAGPLH